MKFQSLRLCQLYGEGSVRGPGGQVAHAHASHGSTCLLLDVTNLPGVQHPQAHSSTAKSSKHFPTYITQQGPKVMYFMNCSRHVPDSHEHD